jgi:hypothetical protein
MYQMSLVANHRSTDSGSLDLNYKLHRIRLVEFQRNQNFHKYRGFTEMLRFN